tara:strand:+ start:13477 stop:14010 length:534 start_codon:yes stop_codon:yes gene_type:complete
MNLPKNKLVHIFDFDETLCKSNAKIKVEDLEQNMSFEIHPTDYPDWREEGWIESHPGRYELDFSNFQGYPLNGEAIKGTVSLLKVLLTSEDDLCVLVTGRDELSGPRAWLLNNGIDADKMILMCSGDPNKMMCYESIINTLQPKDVIIYEDSYVYVEQCRKVCKKYDIKFDYKIIDQ